MAASVSGSAAKQPSSQAREQQRKAPLPPPPSPFPIDVSTNNRGTGKVCGLWKPPGRRNGSPLKVQLARCSLLHALSCAARCIGQVFFVVVVLVSRRSAERSQLIVRCIVSSFSSFPSCPHPSLWADCRARVLCERVCDPVGGVWRRPLSTLGQPDCPSWAEPALLLAARVRAGGRRGDRGRRAMRV